jgi:hypothetical protein
MYRYVLELMGGRLPPPGGSGGAGGGRPLADLRLWRPDSPALLIAAPRPNANVRFPLSRPGLYHLVLKRMTVMELPGNVCIQVQLALMIPFRDKRKYIEFTLN